MGDNGKVEVRRRADRRVKWGVGLVVSGIIFLFLGFFVYGGLFLVGLVLLGVGVVVLDSSESWRRGAEGEERVIGVLEGLGWGDRVFNDVVLPGEESNIDHVVVSEYGVFVIETKNHDGVIECDGDSWKQTKTGRKGTKYEVNIESPSKQAKSNAVKLKKFLEKNFTEIFADKKIFIEPIIVFTNPKVKLKTNNPTVKIIKPEILNPILQGKNQKIFTPEEIQKISKKLDKL